MLVLGVAFSLFGLGFFCWLLFTLAVYALPFFVGLSAGLAAVHSGAGVPGGIVVGIIAAGLMLAVGQLIFAQIRSPIIRFVIGLLYAIPAAIAGYHASLGLAQLGVPGEGWRIVFAVIGALTIGATAFTRMTMIAPPSVGQGQDETPFQRSLVAAGR